MKVYIDGENCRKGLSRILKDAGNIAGSREMNTYRLRDLLSDILAMNDLEINYYASEIRMPNGYQPSGEVLAHVEKIREYTRKWVPELKQQRIRIH
jgi:hypothetical protein